MNKGIPSIQLKEINAFSSHYLFEKQNKMKKEDKLKYFNVLQIMNNFIEIKEAKKNLKDFFLQTKYEKEENDIDEKNFIELINSNNDNYRRKLKGNLIKNFSINASDLKLLD